MNIPRDVFSNWRILIVENDQYSIDVVQRILEYHGAITHTAINGQIALDIVESIEPCFILADLSMPVLDGWEMIKQLKAMPQTTRIPVIALTAHAMIGDREKAIEIGCAGYLTKPLKPQTFMYNLVQILMKIPGFEISIEE